MTENLGQHRPATPEAQGRKRAILDARKERYEQGARAIEINKKLEEQVNTDALTGLPNRRGFYERAEKILANAEARRRGIESQQRTIAIAMLDIDKFKSVNDTRGHAAGDEALRTLAIALRSTLREHGTMGRMGGEEFAIVLDSFDPNAIEAILQRVRIAIQQTPVRYEHDAFNITASIGFTVWKPGDSLETVLKRADAALYEAKNAGRDQIQQA